MKGLVKLIVSLIIKVAFVALVVAIVMGLTSCRKSDKPEAFSFSTEKTEETIGTTKTSSRVTVSETSIFRQEKEKKTEESASNSVTETSETTKKSAAKPLETKKKRVSTKAAAKKESKVATTAPKKTATRAPTKAPAKETTKAPTKSPTKKPTNTPTPKPYTYCTCDAEISCGSTAAGTFHKFTLKGLTAHKLKSGLWEITEASDDKVRAYLKENYPGYGRYGVGKLKNKRDYRYKP